MTPFKATSRRLGAALLLAPAVAGCWGDLVEDQTIGSPASPSGGAIFSSYVAIGTSLGAGFQSGGINDSTQKQGYAYLLAQQMGLRPGVDWLYPALQMPGCPPPLTNVTGGTRVTPAGFPTSTSSSCYLRTSASTRTVAWHNVSVPGIRTRQVLDVTDATFPITDSIKLAQFLVGYRNPIDVAEEARPTFVTLEMGANDVLGGATRGDTTLFTPLADFQADYTEIANRVQATGASVAVMNLPTTITALPNLSLGQVFFALKNITPTAPFSLATFDIDASCSPPVLGLGGVGDSVLVPFATTGVIAAVLTAGGSIRMNCAQDSVAVLTAGASGQALGLRPMLTKPEVRALSQRIIAMNAHIAAEAAARGWAVADWNTALRIAVATGLIPSFPNLLAPSTTIFGSIFSLDGVHPNLAGYKIIANAFIDAINTRYGTTLRYP